MSHRSFPSAAQEAAALTTLHLYLAFANAGIEPSAGQLYAIQSGLHDAMRAYASDFPVLASDLEYLRHHVVHPSPFDHAVALACLDRLRALLVVLSGAALAAERDAAYGQPAVQPPLAESAAP